jgi:DNA-binding NarL/FixJ family response regulator
MILDHQSPQTPAILTWMRGHLPETRLISIMTRAFMAGICLSGIIVKEIQGIVHELSILEELPKAVLAVIHGGTWFSPAFLEAKDLHGGKEERANLPFPVPMLSKRQIEIMECVAQGLINKQIADQLRLSEHTVGGHFKEIFKKLGVHNRQEAVSKYLKGYSQRARELI